MDSYDRPSEVGRAAAAKYLGPGPIGSGRGSRFPVSATVLRGGETVHCRGQLLISADGVVFAPFSSGRRSGDTGELIHAGREIAITTALLRPPWTNAYLSLRGRDWEAVVVCSLFVRRKLVAELRAAGIAVEARSAWAAPRLAESDRGLGAT